MVEKTNIYVVDASWILALLLHENEDTEQQFRDLIGSSAKLISPALLWYEVGNGLASAVLKKRISPREAEKLYESFLNLRIEEQTIDYEKVLSLSKSKKISFYDSSYLFLQKKFKCRLLTFDKKLQTQIPNVKTNLKSQN